MHHTPSNPNDPSRRPSTLNTGTAPRQMLPLTVWLCSDHTEPTSPARRPAVTRSGKICARHRQAVSHQLARHLISLCTREGDVVAEGFTTSEATLVAAAELDRHALAAVPHFPLAQHIGTRLRERLPEHQLERVAMRPCRPDQMARAMADHLGQTALVIAAPPPYDTAGGDGRTTDRQCPACQADLRPPTPEQLTVFLAAAAKLLRPGGVLALVTTARHENHRLIDPAPRIVRQAQALGFSYAQHVIALRVPVTGDALVVQAGPASLAELRDTGSRTLPPAVNVHADVCLLVKNGDPTR